jgi:excisionase family DNA binding protein
MVTETKPRAFRRKGAAQQLNVSTDTLDRWIVGGKIKAFRIGNAVFVSADEIDRFIREAESS